MPQQQPPDPQDRTPRLGGERRDSHRQRRDGPAGDRANRAPLLGGEAARHHLRATLEDDRWVVRRRAVRSLARSDAPGALALLGAALGDRDKRVREAASAALAGRGGPAVVAVLVDVLTDRSHTARAATAQTLAQLDPEQAAQAIPDLIAALRGADGNLRLYASSALMKLGEQAAPALRAVLQDTDWRSRLAAAMTLEEIVRQTADSEPVQAQIILRKALDDPHAEVRQIAARALGEAGDRAAIPALLRMLTSDDPFAREDAAVLLGFFRASAAVDPLTGLLDDEQRGWRGRVCEAAATALMRIGSQRAVLAVERWRQRR